MRGDAALTARLLLRPVGLAGLLAAVGGATGVLAATRPWYEAVARLEMLGRADGRVVAELAGIPDTVVGWVALVLGALALVLGTAVAVDRPPSWTVLALGCSAVAMLVAAVVAPLTAPPLTEVAGAEAGSLVALRDRVPVGVTLELSVRIGVGPWFAALGAIGVAVGAVGARDR